MTNTEAPPALYIHCVGVYNKMLEQATKEVADDETEMIVYQGFFTHLIAQQNLSVPYFTFCRRALMDMKCIRQIKRGGGRSPSQWEMIKTPTLELFTTLDNPDTPKTKALGRQGKQTAIEGQLDSMNNRIIRIEKALEAILEDDNDSTNV